MKNPVNFLKPSFYSPILPLGLPSDVRPALTADPWLRYRKIYRERYKFKLSI